MMKKPLVVLTGPTAVGKTALSIDLAKRINGESVQIPFRFIKEWILVLQKLQKKKWMGLNTI